MPVTGKTEVFPVSFINTPSIIPIPVGGLATRARIESQDNSGFTFKLYDDEGFVKAGNANWTAEGT